MTGAWRPEADACLIVALVNSAPALLREVRALRAVRDAARAVIAAKHVAHEWDRETGTLTMLDDGSPQFEDGKEFHLPTCRGCAPDAALRAGGSK